MTVAQLIAELKKLPPTQKVCTEVVDIDEDVTLVPILGVYTVPVKTRKGVFSDDKNGTRKVVVLK